MFNSIKKTLTLVQDDITTSFKKTATVLSVGGIQRSNSASAAAAAVPVLCDEPIITLNAGSDLLAEYQGIWVELHNSTEVNIKKSRVIHDLLVAQCEKSQQVQVKSRGLSQQLNELPNIVLQIQNICLTISALENLFKGVEDSLCEFEDLIETSDYNRWKNSEVSTLHYDHRQKKSYISALQASLEAERSMEQYEIEVGKQAQLEERQQVFDEAFHEEMEHYKKTGQLQRKPTLSKSDSEAYEDDNLAQVDITDVLDKDELDAFLQGEEAAADSTTDSAVSPNVSVNPIVNTAEETPDGGAPAPET